MITYASIDQATMNDLQKAVLRLADDTRRTIPQAVVFAGIRICDSARAASSPGRARRKVRENPEYKQAKPALRWARAMQKKGKRIPAEAQAALNTIKEIAPYQIERLTQGAPIMIPAFRKNDERRNVPEFDKFSGTPGRGLARHIWVVVRAKLAAKRGKSLRQGAENEKHWNYVIAAKDSGGTFIYSLKILDKLSYIEKWKPGFTVNVVRKGVSGIEGYLNNRLDHAIKKAQLQ